MSYDCDRCGTIMEECDSCEMLSEENDSLHEEIAGYKAQRFINFVATFGDVIVHHTNTYTTMSKEEKEFSAKHLDASQLCIAAYMHVHINQMTFNMITKEAGVTFAQNISDTYREVFKKDFFKIEEGE